MIRFVEYRKMDAVAIAEHLKRGDFESREVLECAIDRAETVNPYINAINCPLYERAREQANHQPVPSQHSGKLAGVPFLVKDLLNDIEGVPTSNGSSAYLSIPISKKSTMVSRFVRLGFNIMGKTNTPEFGLLATTEPRAFGATHNPWNLLKTPGGSSGGSAAAVAAGIVPIASAGDGGGSIRIPASCCGLFGFKPSRGLNPIGPLHESWDGAVSEHVVCRSVRDSLLVLKSTMGPDASAHVPMLIPPDFLAAADIPLQQSLRIAYSAQSLYGGEVDVDCIDAVTRAAAKLADLGHNVEEASPPINGRQLMECYFDIYLANVNADIHNLIRQFGVRFVKKNVETLSFFLYQAGNGMVAGDYLNSRRCWAGFSEVMDRFHEQYDIWMTPVMAVPPFDLGTMQSTELEEILLTAVTRLGVSKYLNRKTLYNLGEAQLHKVPFTQLANITGQPAMSVPLEFSRNGLPVGIQFMAARLKDPLLLQLAFQLEKAHPWFDRIPETIA
ncbi:amidase [Ketobacter sp. MCCC 1A13808]|uniref:amidase n=1 Tax=Ketobacter sp. MCCC 1A13808 TaxID=2602738 RepID=UPI000F13ACF6|nr:amidase family protein [Ketobacter sp. MCCC 1A13808]MVF10557.1 amidase [Ketobacter sp. MCCC 1A13808]RLP55984.1 MAG: amidase [Ketobacter sp.]